MSQVNWIQEPAGVLGRLEWLGAKTDWTPLEREMIKRKGGTTESDFKSYGQVAGAIGGAAGCALFGPAAAVGCGFVGGILGGIIGGIVGQQVKIIAGKSDEEQIAAYWNNAVDAGKLSGRGILAVKSYLTMRDYALSLGYTEEELVKMGLPPAPVRQRWKPSAARYEQAKKNYAYVQGLASKPNPDCSIAKSLGIVNDKLSCADFLYMAFWRGAWGPVAEPSAPIDWYTVGRDEVTAASGQCDNNFPTLEQGKWLDTNVNCTGERPSDTVKPFIAQINALPKVKESKGLPPAVSKRGAGPGPVLVVGGLAAAAALAWWLLA